MKWEDRFFCFLCSRDRGCLKRGVVGELWGLCFVAFIAVLAFLSGKWECYYIKYYKACLGKTRLFRAGVFHIRIRYLAQVFPGGDFWGLMLARCAISTIDPTEKYRVHVSLTLGGEICTALDNRSCTRQTIKDTNCQPR